MLPDFPVTVSIGPLAGPLYRPDCDDAALVSGAGLDPSRRPPNTPAAMTSAAATPRLASRQRRRRRRAAVRSSTVASSSRGGSGASLGRRRERPVGGRERDGLFRRDAGEQGRQAGQAGQLVPAVAAGRQVRVHLRALGRVDGAEYVDAERYPRLRAVHGPGGRRQLRHGASPRSCRASFSAFSA